MDLPQSSRREWDPPFLGSWAAVLPWLEEAHRSGASGPQPGAGVRLLAKMAQRVIGLLSQGREARGGRTGKPSRLRRGACTRGALSIWPCHHCLLRPRKVS